MCLPKAQGKLPFFLFACVSECEAGGEHIVTATSTTLASLAVKIRKAPKLRSLENQGAISELEFSHLYTLSVLVN
jgi:hypothetical protein